MLEFVMIKDHFRVKVLYLFESRYPHKFSRLYINYPYLLEHTLLQSHIPVENAGHFLQL